MFFSAGKCLISHYTFDAAMSPIIVVSSARLVSKLPVINPIEHAWEVKEEISSYDSSPANLKEL
jgi:hypothetical protein